MLAHCTKLVSFRIFELIGVLGIALTVKAVAGTEWPTVSKGKIDFPKNVFKRDRRPPCRFARFVKRFQAGVSGPEAH